MKRLRKKIIPQLKPVLVFFLYLCTCAPVVHISYSFYCESDLLQKVLSAATDLDYFIRIDEKRFYYILEATFLKLRLKAFCCVY